MSFMLTADQIRNRTKTVTRRLGWWDILNPGDYVCAVEKSQGLKKGEKLVRLGKLYIAEMKRERLSAIAAYDADETAREGYPGMSPDDFVAMFCKHMKCHPGDIVTRIKFEYVDREIPTL